MIVLVLGDQEDEHAAHLLRWLRKHGADAEICDSRWFPAQLEVDYDPLSGHGGVRLPGGPRVSFDDIRSVYWRNYLGVATPELPDEQQSYVAYNDARSLFESLLMRLPVRWVNGWRAFEWHQRKPAALAAVAPLGVRTPETLVTNSPEAVRRFAERHPRCIFKPVQGGAHTEHLEPRHLTEQHLRTHLGVAPVTIQEEIPGANIRVFVAGERLLACELKTEALDYRAVTPDIAPHSLPEETRALCRRIAHALHLIWTGMDFRLTPDGEYVFLEANPSPMFLGFEQACGLPLTEALGNLLLE